jgi:hypothetical protein
MKKNIDRLRFNEKGLSYVPEKTAVYLVLGGRVDTSAAMNQERLRESEEFSRQETRDNVMMGLKVAAPIVSTAANLALPGSGAVLNPLFQTGIKAAEKQKEVRTQPIQLGDVSDLTSFGSIQKENAEHLDLQEPVNSLDISGLTSLSSYSKKGGLLNNISYKKQGGDIIDLVGPKHGEGGSHGIDYTKTGSSPTFVEGGEVIWNDFVFTNSATISENLSKKLKLPKNITFAEAVRKLSKESEDRPNDPKSKESRDRNLEILKAAHLEEVPESRPENQQISGVNNVIQGGSYGMYGGDIKTLAMGGDPEKPKPIPPAPMRYPNLYFPQFLETPSQLPYSSETGLRDTGFNTDDFFNNPNYSGKTNQPSQTNQPSSGKFIGPSQEVPTLFPLKKIRDVNPETGLPYHMDNTVRSSNPSTGKSSGSKKAPTQGGGATQSNQPIDDLRDLILDPQTNEQLGLTDERGFEDFTPLGKTNAIDVSKKQKEDPTKNLMHPLRYAPLIGSAGDAVSSLLMRPKPMSRRAFDVENADKAEELNVDPLVAAIDRSEASGRMALTENVSNQNALLAGLTGMTAAGAGSRSEVAMKKQMFDTEQKDRFAASENQINAANSQMRRNVQDMNDANRAGWLGDVSDSVAMFNQNIGALGTEKTYMNMIKEVWPYDANGNYDPNKGAQLTELIRSGFLLSGMNQQTEKQKGKQ